MSSWQFCFCCWIVVLLLWRWCCHGATVINVAMAELLLHWVFILFAGCGDVVALALLSAILEVLFLTGGDVVMALAFVVMALLWRRSHGTEFFC